jgi:hypothetical protein
MKTLKIVISLLLTLFFLASFYGRGILHPSRQAAGRNVPVVLLESFPVHSGPWFLSLR